MSLAVLSALLLGTLPLSTAALASDTLGRPDADVDCTNFVAAADGGQQHAQAVYDADTSDPYGLDGPIGPDTLGEPGIACETPEELGTASLATCQNFRERRHAQALLDATGNADPYGLDPDGNGRACDGGGAPSTGTDTTGGGADQEVLDGGPPATNDGQVIAVAAPLGTGQALEDRLEARFAALEAQFAAFEVRAENGFGAFPSAEDAISTGVTGTTPVVITTGQKARQDSSTITTESLGVPGHSARAQKAREQSGKHERAKKHKGKRDHHKGKRKRRR